MAKRLTDKHPLHQKFEQLMNFCDTLGLQIEFGRYGEFFVKDEQFPGQTFLIKDVESSGNISDFPPNMEYKIIIKD